MWDQIDSVFAQKHGLAPGVAWAKGVAECPAMGKATTVEDIAGCVSFLVGEDARMITGQSIIVDGGIEFS